MYPDDETEAVREDLRWALWAAAFGLPVGLWIGSLLQ